MTSSPAKILGLLAILAAAIAFGIWASRPSRPPLDTDLHSTVGRVLAEETDRQLEGRGSVVLLVPEAPFDMPLVKSQVSTFKKHLPGGVRVEAEETVRLETVGPLDGLLTPALYFDIARKHPSAGAIVSFVGLGAFRDGDLAKVSSGMPPIYIVSVNVPVPDALFERGLVRLAIAPRRGSVSPGQAKAVDEDRGRFDLAYQVMRGAGQSGSDVSKNGKVPK